MTIQRLILAFVTVGLAVIAALVAIAFAGADSGVRSAVRLSAAEARAEIVSTLEADTYAYGEQVAALLLSGKSQSDDLGASRIEMERSLSRLAQVTRQQIARLGGPAPTMATSKLSRGSAASIRSPRSCPRSTTRGG